MRRKRRHRKYNNYLWFYSIIASICLLTTGIGYAILSAENNISIDVTKIYPLLQETIKELLGSGTSVTSGTGTLEKIEQPATEQTTAQTEYRYRGSNPNNYVTFNGEMWRIIGIVDGKVKITKNENIGRYVWNNIVPTALIMPSENIKTSNELVEDIIATPMAPAPSLGEESDWTIGSLQIYLNGTYYNSLSVEAKKMIDSSTWYLGASDYSVKANVIYQDERGTAVCSGYSTKWDGFIGLMYPSDYGYAAEESCSNNYALHKYDNATCTSNNWLSKNDRFWTTTSHNYYCGSAIIIESKRATYCGVNDEAYYVYVYPTVYLNSNVKITRGTGEQNNPYILK